MAVQPHTIIKLPATIVASAQATRFGGVVLILPDKGSGTFGVIRELGHFLKTLALVVAPLLLMWLLGS